MDNWKKGQILSMGTIVMEKPFLAKIILQLISLILEI